MADVIACPECGVEVENTCYHDGEDLPSVPMTLDAAILIRRDYANALFTDLRVDDLEPGDRAELLREAFEGSERAATIEAVAYVLAIKGVRASLRAPLAGLLTKLRGE